MYSHRNHSVFVFVFSMTLECPKMSKTSLELILEKICFWKFVFQKGQNGILRNSLENFGMSIENFLSLTTEWWNVEFVFSFNLLLILKNVPDNYDEYLMGISNQIKFWLKIPYVSELWKLSLRQISFKVSTFLSFFSCPRWGIKTSPLCETYF